MRAVREPLERELADLRASSQATAATAAELSQSLNAATADNQQLRAELEALKVCPLAARSVLADSARS
jgi:hypothetical protein